MPELNKANRQVCDVDIRVLKTMAPFLFFDTANTTTAGLTGDSVYAMKKGSRAIAFQNPIQGTMTIEAQVMPFKAYALFSDGVIESEATYAVKKKMSSSFLFFRLLVLFFYPDSPCMQCKTDAYSYN